MQTIAYLLPALGCAAMMGVMMWMMRGAGGAEASASQGHRREISELRAEIERLDLDRAPGEAESRRG